jgi:hypothetical protein
MARFSVSLVALLLCNAGAWGATAIALGDDWYPVGSRLTELMPPPEIIELRHGALTWNKVPVSRADISRYVQTVVAREPKSPIYLYFTRPDYEQALLLSKDIHRLGGCDVIGCLFKVTGR